MNSSPAGIHDQTWEHEAHNPARAHNCPKKRIIVACDGTWMDSDGIAQIPSNITRIVRAIPPVGVDHSHSPPTSIAQVTFYQNGIGTGSTSWYAQYLGQFISGATGEGLAANIREAYNFICNNYHRGDEIILIGFSRGAFTARSVSTLIQQLGALTPKGLEYMVEICDDWENQLKADWTSKTPDTPWKNRPRCGTDEYIQQLHDLKLTRLNIPIKCVAVWDTVGALGMPRIALFPPKQAQEFAFVDTRVEDNIEFAFHALGLDEKRRSFAPTVWYKPEQQEFPRVLKQTWFPGVHSDIGGSYANDDLANITLSWMIGQLEEHKILTFNRQYIIRQVHRAIQRHEEEDKRLNQQGSDKLERAQTFGPLREWGLGKIHNSYSLFFKIGGATTRTPMEHQEISRDTLKPTGNFLQGTGEKMHASVRVRMALGGRGYDDLGEYESEALKGWKYEWEAYAQPDTPFQLTQPGEVGKLKNVEWVKLRDGKEAMRLAEDKMTEFERLVLRHWTAAEDDWEEGAEDRESLIDSARPIRRESDKMHSPLSKTRQMGKVKAQSPREQTIPEDGAENQHYDHDHADGIPHRRTLSIATDLPS